MRRILEVLIAMALVAGACGGDEPADTTAASPTLTTTEPGSTSAAPPATDAPPADPDDEGWDPTVAEQLIALEAANDGQWTIESALDAMALLRPVFLQGIGSEPPINVSRLVVYLAQNSDQVPDDEWDAIMAAGAPNARLVSYQTEEERLGYQRITEDANRTFESLSSHTLGVPIYVALSDLDIPMDVMAATWTSGEDPDRLSGFFLDESLFQDTKAAIEELSRNGTLCVIFIGGIMRRWPTDRQAAGLLHEAVHCHQQTIHPGGRDGYWAAPALWMDEGYAAWAGEALFGGTLNSLRWWNNYFGGGVGSPPDGFSVFESDYRAIAFYSMLAQGGADPYGEFVDWFKNLRANGVSDTARYSGMADAASGDAIAAFAASSSRNDDFGAPWNTATGPGLGSAREKRDPLGARVGAEPRTFTADPGEQRYWAVEFTTATAEPSLITISTNGPGTYRWDWGEQFVTTGPLDLAYCVGEDCTCEDGTSPAPGATIAPIAAGDRPTLSSALFGGSGNAQLIASVETLEDACEEEEPPSASGPLDACLFGTWNPDQGQLEDFLLTLYRAIATNVTLDAGTIDLSFTDEGEFSQVYNGIQGSGQAGGVAVTMKWSGGSFGTWEASGGVLTLNFTGSDIAVNVNGIDATAPSIPAATVEAGYTCGPTTLVVEPPPGVPGAAWPLPTDWNKAS